MTQAATDANDWDGEDITALESILPVDPPPMLTS